MIEWMPPGLILLAGAFLVAVTRGWLRTLVLLGAPLLALWVVWLLPDGISLTAPFLKYEIELIEAFRQRHPQLPQVACFDTAFHGTMPRVAKMLPIPRRYEA